MNIERREEKRNKLFLAGIITIILILMGITLINTPRIYGLGRTNYEDWEGYATDTLYRNGYVYTPLAHWEGSVYCPLVSDTNQNLHIVRGKWWDTTFTGDSIEGEFEALRIYSGPDAGKIINGRWWITEGPTPIQQDYGTFDGYWPIGGTDGDTIFLGNWYFDNYSQHRSGPYYGKGDNTGASCP